MLRTNKGESDIRGEAAWSFETERFFVGFYAEPEECDPADSFENEEDIEDVRSGRVDWFCAAVRVYVKDDNPCWWREVGSDYLGGCAYANVRDFYTDWRTGPDEYRNTLANKDKGIVICNYFPGMVRSAIDEARKALENDAVIGRTLRR